MISAMRFSSCASFVRLGGWRVGRSFSQAAVKDKRKIRLQEDKEEYMAASRATIPAESLHGSFYSFSTGLPLIFDREKQETPPVQKEYNLLTRTFALDSAEKKHIDFLYTLLLHGIMTNKAFVFRPFVEERLANRLAQFIKLKKETNLKLRFNEELKEKRLEDRLKTCKLRESVVSGFD